MTEHRAEVLRVNQLTNGDQSGQKDFESVVVRLGPAQCDGQRTERLRVHHLLDLVW